MGHLFVYFIFPIFTLKWGGELDPPLWPLLFRRPPVRQSAEIGTVQKWQNIFRDSQQKTFTCSRLETSALSFYMPKFFLERSKLVLTSPSCFFSVQFVFDRIKNVFSLSPLDPSPKRFGTVQNSLGPIEGQGIPLKSHGRDG